MESFTGLLRAILITLCPLAILSLNGCQSQSTSQAASPETVRDVHSYARPTEAVVSHVHLDLSVDFDEKRLNGKALLTINNKTGTDRLHLDTRDLAISRITLGEDEKETTFTLGESQPYMGSELEVKIDADTRQVHIYYQTSPEAEALQWLSPAQTAGGKHPFLFTQSQAILARTWVPCQDSPGIRITYSASIKTDPQLMAVMSAENDTKLHSDGIYHFKMEQPVPAYLLALAVGDIEFRSLGERSGVYAEPSVIAAAAFEFADTEKMMTAAEGLYGPYRWDRYDLIVLPPSFPFGGMENPRLTFATPTILAGDRSLVSLVAHELAHSWSGNLVTNATWNDFWLNEGFTSYFENRIMEEIYGDDYALMLAQLSYQDAVDAVDGFADSPEETHLLLDLAGRNPDDGMTSIAYDKGSLFLRTLEKHFGREKFDAFLKAYFNSYAFKSMTTDYFVEYLRKNLLNNDAQLYTDLNVDGWIYGPGIPGNAAIPVSGEFAKVETQLQKFEQGARASTMNTDNWTTHHWLHFLRNLPQELSRKQMVDLNQTFGLTGSGNSEIQFAWFMHCIRHKFEPSYKRIEAFLSNVGRRKFIKPLYEEMAKTPEGKKWAVGIYRKVRDTYHPVTYNSVDTVLEWDKQ